MSTREILKHALVPLLKAEGFKGSFPHFRRFHSNRVELLSIQFDKWGSGRFVVEIAVAPRGDFKTYWGKDISETRLKAQDLSERLRLGTSESHEDYWFPSPESNPQNVASAVISFLNSQGMAYYKKGGSQSH